MKHEWVVEASRLSRIYRPKRSLFSTKDTPVIAIKDVSLCVQRGRTLGITGPSGSGKSTLARCLACLEKPDCGELRIDGQDVLQLRAPLLRSVRRQVQMIPQGSASSLNPAFTALEVVREPLDIVALAGRREREQRALAGMERVGLARQTARRRPSELSGGQCQRLALARALMLEPKVMILDEALAGLDLAVKAEIVNLLLTMQEQHRIAYVFISHDLPLTMHISDCRAVMQAGSIIEEYAQTGDTECR